MCIRDRSQCSPIGWGRADPCACFPVYLRRPVPTTSVRCGLTSRVALVEAPGPLCVRCRPGPCRPAAVATGGADHADVGVYGVYRTRSAAATLVTVGSARSATALMTVN